MIWFKNFSFLPRSTMYNNPNLLNFLADISRPQKNGVLGLVIFRNDLNQVCKFRLRN